MSNVGINDSFSQAEMPPERLNVTVSTRGKHEYQLKNDELPEASFSIGTILGLDPQKEPLAVLNALRSNPELIRAIASSRLTQQRHAHAKEEDLKNERWQQQVDQGEMTDSEQKVAFAHLKRRQHEEQGVLETAFQKVVEEAESRRQHGERRTFKKTAEETQELMAKKGVFDSALVKKYVNDLPGLDTGQKSATAQGKHIAKSGPHTSEASVFAAADGDRGTAELPSAGILTAIGVAPSENSSALASNVSSFIAICHPEAKDILERAGVDMEEVQQRDVSPGSSMAEAREVAWQRVLSALAEAESSGSPVLYALTSLQRALQTVYAAEKQTGSPEALGGQENWSASSLDSTLLQPVSQTLRAVDLAKLQDRPKKIRCFASYRMKIRHRLESTENTLKIARWKNLVNIGRMPPAARKKVLAALSVLQQSETILLESDLQKILLDAEISTKPRKTIARVTWEQLETALAKLSRFDRDQVKKSTNDLPSLDAAKHASVVLGSPFPKSDIDLPDSSLLLAAGVEENIAELAASGILTALNVAHSKASLVSSIASFLAICILEAKNITVEAGKHGDHLFQGQAIASERGNAEAEHGARERVLELVSQALSEATSADSAEHIRALTALQQALSTVLAAENRASKCGDDHALLITKWDTRLQV